MLRLYSHTVPVGVAGWLFSDQGLRMFCVCAMYDMCYVLGGRAKGAALVAFMPGCRHAEQLSCPARWLQEREEAARLFGTGAEAQAAGAAATFEPDEELAEVRRGAVRWPQQWRQRQP